MLVGSVSNRVAGFFGSAGRTLESTPVPPAVEAEEYDDLVRRHAWLLNRPFVEMVSEAAGEMAGARVLDVGTGPGWIPIELAQRHPAWEIHGLDASPDMLECARRHAAGAGVAGRVRFLHGDASALPFADGTFDLCISHYMLHHLEHPVRLFDEMARVTRGGGLVMIKDLARQPRWVSAAMMAFSRTVLGYSAEQVRKSRESLHAALTVREVRGILARSRLSGARVRGVRGMDLAIDARMPASAGWGVVR